MGEPSVDGMSQEINARIASSAGPMTSKEADDDERQDDGGGCTAQIQGKWQRQVITLTETMRAGRDRPYAKPGKSGAECKQPLASADRPQRWPTADPHAHDRRRLLLARGYGPETAR